MMKITLSLLLITIWFVYLINTINPTLYILKYLEEYIVNESIEVNYMSENEINDLLDQEADAGVVLQE